MTTWWHEHNEYWRGDSSASLFPDHLVELLDAVEARFDTHDGHSLEWPDPHSDPSDALAYRAPADDEHSRVTHPERFDILEVRVSAWLDTAQERGLAQVATRAGDADSHGADGRADADAISPSQVWIATPLNGGPPMRIAVWRSTGDGLMLEVGLGDPAVTLVRVPDCGCDACDDGSASLLEELDRAILAIVDGCVEIVMNKGERRQRTAWSAESGSDWLFTEHQNVVVRGASWFPGHSSMPLMPSI